MNKKTSTFNEMNKAIIYARCSTDENKQDVEIQLKELRRYCDAYGWQLVF